VGLRRRAQAYVLGNGRLELVIRSIINSALVGLMALALHGCAGMSPRHDGMWVGYRETGEASFYSSKLQSRKTASGEIFDQSMHTAAHKELPFGTKVKVTNLQNGKSVIVRINDRGPFVRGRIMDLSRSAFSHIGNTGAGIINVKIELVN